MSVAAELEEATQTLLRVLSRVGYDDSKALSSVEQFLDARRKEFGKYGGLIGSVVFATVTRKTLACIKRVNGKNSFLSKSGDAGVKGLFYITRADRNSIWGTPLMGVAGQKVEVWGKPEWSDLGLIGFKAASLWGGTAFTGDDLLLEWFVEKLPALEKSTGISPLLPHPSFAQQAWARCLYRFCVQGVQRQPKNAALVAWVNQHRPPHFPEV